MPKKTSNLKKIEFDCPIADRVATDVDLVPLTPPARKSQTRFNPRIATFRIWGRG